MNFAFLKSAFKLPMVPPSRAALALIVAMMGFAHHASATAPAFVNAGAVATGTGAITPALPASILQNDILLLFLETSNQAITIANQSGGTWTEVTISPQGTGTAATTAATRLTVFWSRYNGTQTAPVTSDSGNRQLGRIIAVRGVVTLGNPWDITAGAVEAGNTDTSGSIPGANTGVIETFVVAAIGTSLPDATGTAVFSSFANASLTSFQERTDDSSTSGVGGALGIATGLMATTGTYNATTVTTSVATAKAMMSIALKPQVLDHFVVEAAGGGSIGTQTAGTPFSIRITAQDVNNQTMTLFTGTVNITSTGTLSAGGGTTAAFTAGVLTSSVTFSNSGSFTITATATATGTSNAFTVNAAGQPGRFNAVEVGGNALTGVIKTKIAGANVSLDIVAIKIDQSGVETGFNNDVKVQVYDGSPGGTPDATTKCSPSWTLISTSPASWTVTLTNGIGTINNLNVANVFPDARIRIATPATGPETVVGCSTDNFAIRPNTFANFAVTDTDWQTTGTPGARALNLLTFAATTPIHKAGRPFSVRATAVNAAGTPATTTNYTGAPTATLSACVGAACTATFGTVTLTTTFAAGQLSSDVASYNNVGSFALQLVDSTFANVDASDGSTTTERNITSGTPINVGRFVPDHFAVAFNTPVFGTTCGSFTYIGQVFNYTTAPVITVTSKDFADNTTTLYNTINSWWRITSASLTGKAYAAAAGTLNTSGLPGTDPVIASSGLGVGTLTFGSGTGLLFTRTAPVAPFNADISLAINVIDADGVTYVSNPASFGAATAGNGIAFSGGKPMRFGQLQLTNALGSELLNLPIPIQTQYWNGTSFVTNTLDSCTTIAASNIALSNYQGALTSGNLPSGNISISGAFTAGVGNLKLTKPSSAVNGSVDLCVDLGGDATCVATPAGMSYLQGVWSGTTYTLDPRARAAFGFSKGSYSGSGRNPYVYQRENY